MEESTKPPTDVQPKSGPISGYCVLCGARRKDYPSRKYHTFPSNPVLSNKWACITGKKWVIAAPPAVRHKRYRICSEHFSSEQYTDLTKRRLQPSAIPTPLTGVANQSYIMLDISSVQSSINKKLSSTAIPAPFEDVSDSGEKTGIKTKYSEENEDKVNVNKRHIEDTGEKTGVKRKYSEENEDKVNVNKRHIEGYGKLSVDFRDLLFSGNDSDVIFKVQDREFKAHRIILQARCPYFDSMFTHDMKVKKSGVVIISDCVPEVFEELLVYLYTGKVQKILASNVVGLYQAADKYGIDPVKEECVQFMMDTLSVEIFCDVFALALQYNETTLAERATNFFLNNEKEIISGVQWLSFMKEHPVKAIELHIKAVDRR